MLSRGVINQHGALTLDNGVLRVVVLPKKGADIYALIHVASGVDFLVKTPAGLRPPSGQPVAHFLENYEGGWQVLLPNGNDACQYGGVTIPFHGEAALLPWEILDERDDSMETAVRLLRKGGTAVAYGLCALDQRASFSPFHVTSRVRKKTRK